MRCTTCRDARRPADTKQPHRRVKDGGAVDSLLAGKNRSNYIIARTYRVKRKGDVLRAYLAGRIDADLARWQLSLTGPFPPLGRV